MAQVTVNLDELFDKLNYCEQLEFLKKKLKEQHYSDKIKIFEDSYTHTDLVNIITNNIDTAIDVVEKYDFSKIKAIYKEDE